MKTCLCCGKQAFADVPTCVICGEGSWSDSRIVVLEPKKESTLPIAAIGSVESTSSTTPADSMQPIAVDPETAPEIPTRRRGKKPN